MRSKHQRRDIVYWVYLLQSRNCELVGAYACPDLESHVSTPPPPRPPSPLQRKSRSLIVIVDTLKEYSSKPYILCLFTLKIKNNLRILITTLVHVGSCFPQWIKILGKPMTPVRLTDFQVLWRSCELFACIEAEICFCNQFLVLSIRTATCLW